MRDWPPCMFDDGYMTGKRENVQNTGLCDMTSYTTATLSSKNYFTRQLVNLTKAEIDWLT